jgi:hypothetical protein
MKLKLTAALVVALALSQAVQAQQFIREYLISGSGAVQSTPVAIAFNPTYNTFHTLHSTTTGSMEAMRVNNTNYRPINGALISETGVALTPVAIAELKNMSYVLYGFNVSILGNPVPRYGICAFDHTSNTLVWTKELSCPSGIISVVPVDLTCDGTNTLFVTASSSVIGGLGEIYVASVNATTAGINWQQQYGIPVYGISPNNINFASNGSLYIGGIACNPGSIIDRAAYILRVSTAGLLQGDAFIQYTNCISNRVIAPTAKYHNGYVYLFAPSYIGADGNGVYYLAKLDAAISSILLHQEFIPGSFYPNTNFEFVNGGNNIFLHGIASPMDLGTPGYIDLTYTLNFVYSGGRKFPNMPTRLFPGSMISANNPVSNQVYTVLENPSNTANYYSILSNSNGYVGACDTAYQNYPVYCPLVLTAPTTSVSGLKGGVYLSANMLLTPITQTYTIDCTAPAFCPSCQVANPAGEPGTGLTIGKSRGELNVYPNPAESALHITLSQDAITHITLMDLNGRSAKTEIQQISTNEHQLDLSTLTPGIYFLTVETDAGYTLHEKIVKQ